MIKQQEELEAAVFRKFFYKKIKKRSCLKKLQYTALVLLFALGVCSYFLWALSRVHSLDNWIQESLSYFQIIANRNPSFSSMVVFYRESISRGNALLMKPAEMKNGGNTTEVVAF